MVAAAQGPFWITTLNGDSQRVQSNRSSSSGKTSPRFQPWMKFCLYFCATITTLYGLLLVVLFDFAMPWLGVGHLSNPLVIQLLGVFYLVQGLMTGLVAQRIQQHFPILLPVMLAKSGTALFVIVYVIVGRLSFAILPVVLLVDFVFLLPLCVIYRSFSAAANRMHKDATGKDSRGHR